jgi:hypothetical protein
MRLVIMLLALTLAGCAGSGDYAKYVDAQAQLARENQKPLLILEAQDGQPIAGLKRLEVNAPGGNPGSVIAAPRNEWAGVIQSGLGVLGTVGGVVAGGMAAKGLATAVGNAATAGYSHVQAPGASTVTTTTNTASNGSVAGGGSVAPVTSTTTATTTTTTTDNHSQTAPPTVVQPQPGRVCAPDATGAMVCQ